MFPETGPINGLRMRQLAGGHLHAVATVARGVAYNMATPVGGVMPAEHGTKLLRHVNGEVETTDVAAWLISTSGAVPITAKGMHGGFEANDYVVEFSMGQIYEPGCRTWANRADWLLQTSPAAEAKRAAAF